MNLSLWPFVLRDDLVRAFRPGEPAAREAPFRTLRDHEWATTGVAVHARQGGRAAGRVVVFSALNVDAAIYARCGDAPMAAALAKAAASLEHDAAFLRLQTLLTGQASAVVSSIAAGELAAASPFVELIRRIARKTAAVRKQHRFATLASWYHVGRISSVADAYITIEGEGKQSFVPRALARAALRERVGDCLAIMNRPVDGREMIVRAVPGIALEVETDQYSPFRRPAEGFHRVSATDLAHLQGIPSPLKITIPITIER